MDLTRIENFDRGRREIGLTVKFENTWYSIVTVVFDISCFSKKSRKKV